MKKCFLFPSLILACICCNSVFGQYQFTNDIKLNCTSVKSQDQTGTCWSFSTSSFLESELMRMGKGEYDLSEMFIVRNIYMDKARNYLLRQGKANFSQGSLAHDVIRAFSMFGIVPESVFAGKAAEAKHDHGEMEAGLKGFLDGILTQKKIGSKWKPAVSAILDAYFGAVPENFQVGSKKFTAETFAESFQINPDDYVSITSFAHHPFYEKFILEIPDNYSNGSFYNVPLDELERIVDNALKKGYSISWDGDVSEKGFSAKNGVAIMPAAPEREDLFQKPGKEINVTQENRQEAFESLLTTDDHLMHLLGTARDQAGNKYYLIKNSWGEVSEYKGFLYMSAAYFRMKTISVLVHKNAIPEDLIKKMGV